MISRAFEHESDYSEPDVLVDPGQRADAYLDSRLFEHLSSQAVLDRLVKFKDAARWLPLAVVPPSYDQDLTLVVHHDAGHGN